jgi:hypothetical protein
MIAISHGIGIKLADAPAGFTELENETEIADRADLPPLYRVFGAMRSADGRWSLPAMTAEGTSTSGSLHLGPIHVVLEAAALEIGAGAAGSANVSIEDWTVTFVARGTHGPFQAEGTAVTGTNGRIGCAVTLRDLGRDGRTVATAVATLRAART